LNLGDVILTELGGGIELKSINDIEKMSFSSMGCEAELA
jgi:hypothetical protein